MRQDCLDDARKLGILKYIGAYEQFSSDEEKIMEALYRASAVCLLAYENNQQSYEDAVDSTQKLKDFCQKHGFDFGEYCQDLQIYDTMEENNSYNEKERYTL